MVEAAEGWQDIFLQVGSGLLYVGEFELPHSMADPEAARPPPWLKLQKEVFQSKGTVALSAMTFLLYFIRQNRCKSSLNFKEKGHRLHLLMGGISGYIVTNAPGKGEPLVAILEYVPSQALTFPICLLIFIFFYLSHMPIIELPLPEVLHEC